ncbi:hypothetical protein P4133_33595 [Pseudomonas aeruginosa]|nr:hypothetical protein [Pseudomonas aeruginosa]
MIEDDVMGDYQEFIDLFCWKNMNMARKDFSSAALVIDKGSSNHIIADHLSKTINSCSGELCY